VGGAQGGRSVQHPEDVRSELQHPAHPVWHGRPCFLELIPPIFVFYIQKSKKPFGAAFGPKSMKKITLLVP